ncbi:MAG: 30S ribosomal protein S2 [Sedimentisphaerales bacterium]|nr:30S ribosomal protein S2 [Sedimentisphaerales bacterium]
MDNTIVRELVDAGVHFGHRVGRWNPKMQPYIFCSRNSIHIINIKETIKGLIRSKKFLANVVSNGKDVLFVGTKRQARQPIVEQAQRSGMHYVSERWLGGTLTNFSTIRRRLGRLEELEEMEEKGLLAAQSKKMESTLRRELRKIKRNLEGIRNMNRLPGALVIIDARREHLAIAEARKLKIPSICLIDTDSDPDLVDIPIPGNDDAMRAIQIMCGQLADAILEGKAAQPERTESASEDRRPRSRRMSIAQTAERLAHNSNQPAEASAPDGSEAQSSAAQVAGKPENPAVAE